ncbi:hypothetical protein DOC35_19400 [Salmonella enterica subsp. enterica]|nr:hypothetical protein [Salmonella enterica subsp. enterica]
MSITAIFNRLATGARKPGERVEAFTPEEHHASEEAQQASTTRAQRRAISEALFFYREARRREGWQARQAATEQATGGASYEWHPLRPARRAATR